MLRVEADLICLDERVKHAKEIVEQGKETEEVREAIANAMHALNPVARIKMKEYREELKGL